MMGQQEKTRTEVASTQSREEVEQAARHAPEGGPATPVVSNPKAEQPHPGDATANPGDRASESPTTPAASSAIPPEATDQAPDHVSQQAVDTSAHSDNQGHKASDSTTLAIVHPVPKASTNPSRWGRVAADGTVYLNTPDGERAVGNWQAGGPAEGLAHYARRFDDLLTEAELLEARLSAGTDPKHTVASARHLREGLDEAAVVGDVAGLAEYLDSLIARAEEAVSRAKAEREALRAQAIARKEELVAEAEQLAKESTQWKQAGDRFKAMLEEWRAIRGIDRKTDEQLWKRFSRARDAFNRRRGSHFAELDRQRAAAKARKEELVAEAESLADSTEWGATAARYKQLMADWKAAGRAQKEADDALWQRFRAAQEKFFTRRAAVFAERDAEFAANAAKKEQLLAEAERIDTSKPESARAALRSILERWEAAGKVPRDRVRELESRLRAVEDRIRGELDRRWRRPDPEADARVAQFRERVRQFEAQAAKARAAGDLRRAEQAQGQAEQWREWLATAEKALQR